MLVHFSFYTCNMRRFRLRAFCVCSPHSSTRPHHPDPLVWSAYVCQQIIISRGVTLSDVVSRFRKRDLIFLMFIGWMYNNNNNNRLIMAPPSRKSLERLQRHTNTLISSPPPPPPPPTHTHKHTNTHMHILVLPSDGSVECEERKQQISTQTRRGGFSVLTKIKYNIK